MPVGVIYNDLDIDYYRESIALCTGLLCDLEELHYLLFTTEEPTVSSYESGISVKERVNNFLKRFDKHTSIPLLITRFSEVDIKKAISHLKVIKGALLRELSRSPTFDIIVAFPNGKIKFLREEEIDNEHKEY